MNVSINYDGVLVTDSTSRWYGNVDISNFRFPFTISTFVKSNDSGYRTGQLKCYYIDENKRFLNSKFGSSSSESNQMTALTILENNLPVGTKYIEFRITLKNSYTEKTQIELNTTRTNYVEHEEQTISIPTQQPMRSIGDVRDCFVKKDGNWFERHYIGEVVLDGSRVWIKSATYSNETYFCGYLNATVTNIIDGSLTLNNSFQIGRYSSVLDKECMSNNVQLHVRILASRLTENSANGFKQWLSTHNVKAYGRYVTPLDLPCTELQSQILDSLTEDTTTYKGGTYISSEDEVKARIKVSGLKDLNVMFENLTNAIISQGANT